MKIRRTIFWLIVTVGLLSLLALPVFPAAAADIPVRIGVTAQVTAGGDFTAKVNIGSVPDFDAAQYDVTYNPAVIQVTGVTAGLIGSTTIPVSSWGYIPASTQGKIRVINNVPGTPGVTGSGYLAEIHFHVIGSVGANSDISLSNGILGDKNAGEITASWTPGSVSVVASVTADFSADKPEVLVNQSVTFTANTSGGSGSYTYAWAFGDSGTSTQANPTHSYTTPGSYTVALTVTDTFDGSDTETKTNYITVYAALAAGASANINEAVVGQTVTFSSATTTGGKAGSGYTYAWDFKDGNTSTAANPTHSYSTSGTYAVSLKVTDSLGNTSSTAVTVTVYMLGDADKSGTVNVLDITHVEHIIMGDSGYVYTTWADAKQDGSINALDIIAIELNIIP